MPTLTIVGITKRCKKCGIDFASPLCRSGRPPLKCQAIDRSVKYPDSLSASIDHIVPVSKGGDHTYANVRCAHLGCNCARRDDTQKAA